MNRAWAGADLPILMVGLNHRVAPLDLRERLAFGPTYIVPALRSVAPQDGSIAEAVLLSTCNRTEIYVTASDLQAAASAVESFIFLRAKTPGQELGQMLYTLLGQDAVRHLFRAAAGLDSLILGEHQILGQVRSAADLARSAGTSGPILSALFRHAIEAGKRTRTETAMGRQNVSVATIAVEMAEQLLGPLAERTALLIGAGKISSMTGRALTQAGLHCIMVANRTYERAQKLARALDGVVVHFDALDRSLLQADIVICSTGAPHVVLHADAVEAAQRGRQGRPLLIFDLAVPRDVDPIAAAIPGVRLVNVDDLKSIVTDGRSPAAAACQEAEGIVEDEVGSFCAWYRSRRFAPIIAAMRRRADEVCQAEVEKTLRRLGSLTPPQQQLVRAMGRAIAGRLLHEPTILLRNLEPGADEPSHGEARREAHGAP